MRRALRRAVGVLLATGVVGLARPALAQPSSYLVRSQQTAVRTVQYEENTALSEGHSRLEEMKVNLALLSDVATFPYYLAARASGETLDVRGYVPNELVKQRALNLARRNTFLSVTDGLKLQNNLSLRPSLRDVAILHKEGSELLVKNLGEAGRQMRLDVRSNGLIAVHGQIDSVEEKVGISQLFRQLSGCSGVVNQLSVQPILRDGQRVVQVTKDGTQIVPLTALGMEPEQVASPPAPRLTPIVPVPIAETTAPAPAAPPQKQAETLPRQQPATLPAPQPTLPTPTPLPRGLDTRQDESRLPTIIPAKPDCVQPVSSTADRNSTVYPTINPATSSKADSTPNVSPASKPTAGESRSAFSWESESKTPAKSVTIQVTPATPIKEKSNKVTRTNKSDTFASDATSPAASSSGSADALLAPATPKKWNHPMPWDSVTASKPATTPTKAAPVTPALPAAPPAVLTSASGPSDIPPKHAAPATPSTPTDASALRPARRWPPAYAAQPIDSGKGRPGVIIFEEEPAPKSADPAAQPSATGASRPIGLENLKRQVKSVCGRQARDVVVETRADGSVLVKVKVANARAEQQLPSKILTIPEMSAPNVHLATVVEP